MTERKFTPPVNYPDDFPAEYVDGTGAKVVIYGRGQGKYPLIGQDIDGDAAQYSENGTVISGPNRFDLHDLPKRITTWHNVYEDFVWGPIRTREGADQCSTEYRLCVYRIERDEDGENPQIFVEDV